MAPLNGTILWHHKIAPFFKAINLLVQNLWRHKLSLSCVILIVGVFTVIFMLPVTPLQNQTTELKITSKS